MAGEGNLQGAVADQGPAAAESGELEAQTGGGSTDAIGDSQTVQSGAETDNGAGQTLETKTLPPELEETRKGLLRDYHAKMQKMAEDRRVLEAKYEGSTRAEKTLHQLQQQEWFKAAIAAEKARRSVGDAGSRKQSLSPDEFQNIASDPRAFEDYFDRRERELRAEMQGILEKRSMELADLKQEREFDKAAGRWKDFEEVHEKGLLDPYLQKGLGYQEAYKLYNYDRGEHESPKRIRDEAEKLIQQKKLGSVEKGGVAQVRGQQIVKAKNFNDAFDKLFDATMKGIPVKLERE